MPGAHLPKSVKDLIVHWRLNDGEAVEEIARRAQCSESTVWETLRTYRIFGTVSNPTVQARGRLPELDSDDHLRIEQYLLEHPGAYLDEIQLFLRDIVGVTVSVPTVSRTLRKLAITNKRISKKAAEANEQVRSAWLAANGDIPVENIVWLDESSVDDITNQRRRGWAAMGQACVRRDTFLRGQRYSMLPALTVDGIIALDIFEGSVTKERFLQFLEEQIVRVRLCHGGPRVLTFYRHHNSILPVNDMLSSLEVS